MSTSKTIVYVDMDGVLSDYHSRYRLMKRNEPNIEFPQSQYGFFRKLEPITNAIEAVKKLHDRLDIDLYILSTPSVKNPMSYTEKREWIEEHLGMDFARRLILSTNKGLNIGDFLIDDNINGNGQENFRGTLLHFGSEKFKDWNSVVSFFEDGINTEVKSIINLIVMRSDKAKLLSEFYNDVLGLNFEYHQHGNGPYHYSCMINDILYEIYKSTQNFPVDPSLRLGFTVSNLDNIVSRMNNSRESELYTPKVTQWGYRVVIRDIEGRKIELLQRK
jgi:5'-nucleotidase